MPQIVTGFEHRMSKDTLRVTRTSVFTGKVHVRDMLITDDQWAAWRHQGQYIQTAMPHLSADEREFLMTGATPEEWAAEFGS